MRTCASTFVLLISMAYANKWLPAENALISSMLHKGAEKFFMPQSQTRYEETVRPGRRHNYTDFLALFVPGLWDKPELKTPPVASSEAPTTIVTEGLQNKKPYITGFLSKYFPGFGKQEKPEHGESAEATTGSPSTTAISPETDKAIADISSNLAGLCSTQPPSNRGNITGFFSQIFPGFGKPDKPGQGESASSIPTGSPSHTVTSTETDKATSAGISSMLEAKSSTQPPSNGRNITGFVSQIFPGFGKPEKPGQGESASSIPTGSPSDIVTSTQTDKATSAGISSTLEAMSSTQPPSNGRNITGSFSQIFSGFGKPEKPGQGESASSIPTGSPSHIVTSTQTDKATSAGVSSTLEAMSSTQPPSNGRNITGFFSQIFPGFGKPEKPGQRESASSRPTGSPSDIVTSTETDKATSAGISSTLEAMSSTELSSNRRNITGFFSQIFPGFGKPEKPGQGEFASSIPTGSPSDTVTSTETDKATSAGVSSTLEAMSSTQPPSNGRNITGFFSQIFPGFGKPEKPGHGESASSIPTGSPSDTVTSTETDKATSAGVSSTLEAMSSTQPPSNGRNITGFFSQIFPGFGKPEKPGHGESASSIPTGSPSNIATSTEVDKEATAGVSSTLAAMPSTGPFSNRRNITGFFSQIFPGFGKPEKPGQGESASSIPTGSPSNTATSTEVDKEATAGVSSTLAAMPSTGSFSNRRNVTGFFPQIFPGFGKPEVPGGGESPSGITTGRPSSIATSTETDKTTPGFLSQIFSGFGKPQTPGHEESVATTGTPSAAISTEAGEATAEVSSTLPTSSTQPASEVTHIKASLWDPEHRASY